MGEINTGHDWRCRISMLAKCQKTAIRASAKHLKLKPRILAENARRNPSRSAPGTSLHAKKSSQRPPANPAVCGHARMTKKTHELDASR